MANGDEHDDEEEHEVVAVPFFPVRHVTQEEIDTHNMNQQSIQHELYRVFDDMTEDQVRSVQRMMHIISHVGTGMADHLEGIAVGVLHVKFGICIPCGVNHDKEAAEMIERDGGGDDGRANHPAGG